ncbi:MAG: GNAT family N-acetyltransferase [Chloroflexota bacterium]|nr:GNAT family N-acetyltransferase [Chloroflexota bacterium]MDE2839236.1 GNAT family N-acetyltransferase [Chloroflexota bacterium]
MNQVIPELQPTPERRPAVLVAHDVTLRGGAVALRPMAEGDWDVLLKWNNDPAVMELADANPFEETTLEDLQTIYRWISTHAYCFIMEVAGKPIGECWLQRMNLQRIVAQFPDQDLRRIDLMIGEKELWGRGYGTEAIRLLVEFGFRQQGADAIFAPVAADNRRSQRAFQKNGFTCYARHRESDGSINTDLVLWRKQFAHDGV